VAERRKRGSWGGRRPGSGRPRLFDESSDLTVRFSKEDFDTLVTLAETDNVSVAELVREAVGQYVARRRKR
jgi:hypothetical protein